MSIYLLFYEIPDDLHFKTVKFLSQHKLGGAGFLNSKDLQSINHATYKIIPGKDKNFKWKLFWCPFTNWFSGEAVQLKQGCWMLSRQNPFQAYQP